jgi:uncharacterized protein YjiS (DUF1127 family)
MSVLALTVRFLTSGPVRLARAGAARGLDAIVTLAVALKHRADVQALAEVDARMLKDIGLDRSDVIAALAQPWRRDPSAHLVSLAAPARREAGSSRRPAMKAGPREADGPSGTCAAVQPAS